MASRKQQQRSTEAAPLEGSLTKAQRASIEAAASARGLTPTAYLLALHERAQAQREAAPTKAPAAPRVFFKTGRGRAYLGDSLGLLTRTLAPASVDLVVTSPPFGLVYKKAYGNEDADRYLDWFRPFAAGVRRVLRERGSLVIDIGGAWNRGQPTRSLYHFKLLVMLCEEYGYHLAQEFYWWNPAKLPSPAEWVTVRRVRVKDAINCVWWLSPSPYPRASNLRVLQPYSPDMQRLLRVGYRAKKRPSGHDITGKFARRNAGSIPPNLLVAGNNESNSRYLRYCEQQGVPVHPARFSSAIPRYFVRMLTDPGDTVLDPFAGSCVTGEVCEALERRWICGELREDYLKGARGRFLKDRGPQDSKDRSAEGRQYSVWSPDAVADGDTTALPADGGESRSRG
ncbi:MAG: site-specific DNA-methyltransferase [Myxococcales bacterium]|nr:site-specific DNA-methyltransferase [Myxococcales bacterium]